MKPDDDVPERPRVKAAKKTPTAKPPRVPLDKNPPRQLASDKPKGKPGRKPKKRLVPKAERKESDGLDPADLKELIEFASFLPLHVIAAGWEEYGYKVKHDPQLVSRVQKYAVKWVDSLDLDLDDVGPGKMLLGAYAVAAVAPFIGIATGTLHKKADHGNQGNGGHSGGEAGQQGAPEAHRRTNPVDVLRFRRGAGSDGHAAHPTGQSAPGAGGGARPGGEAAEEPGATSPLGAGGGSDGAEGAQA